MSELSNKRCVPCTGAMTPLAGQELQQHMDLLEEGWALIDGRRIEKCYFFKDFKGALGFVNALGKIAQEQGHHPEIELSWGKAKIAFWTHKIGGLSPSDFVMAAKCDAIFTSKVH